MKHLLCLLIVAGAAAGLSLTSGCDTARLHDAENRNRGV